MYLNAIVDPETIYLLQEPVQNEGDIIRFCEESGLLVALDETIDSIREHPLDKLVKYTHPGIVATVIKLALLAASKTQQSLPSGHSSTKKWLLLVLRLKVA